MGKLFQEFERYRPYAAVKQLDANQRVTGEPVAPTTTSSSDAAFIEKDVRFRAFTFALFGWGVEESSNYAAEDVASCDACFRRLGLWLYRPRELSGGGIGEPRKDKLDLMGEHRHYCPWANATTQLAGWKASDGELDIVAGWQIAAKTILNAARLIRSSLVSSSNDPIQAMSSPATDVPALPQTTADREDNDKKRFALIRKLTKSFRVKKPKKEDE